MGCDFQVDYGQFALSLYRQAVKDRVPIYGAVELTRRCNLRCIHCYCNLPAGDRQAKARELPAADWERILRETAELGCLWMVITGGEPLLHPEFRRIFRSARDCGLLLTLFTNGVLIDEGMADFLAEVAPFRVEITMYGATAATYEGVTRVPGSFDRAIAAVERLLARDVKVALKTMALNQSVHELEAVEAMARTKYEARFRFDGVVTPRLDGGAGPLGSRLSASQVVELDLRSDGKRRGLRELQDRFLSPEGRKKTLRERTLFDCGAGRVAFGVDPSGVMRVCSLAGSEGVDLAGCSAREAWEGELAEQRSRLRDSSSPCLDCVLRPLCDSCPVHAEMETGNPEDAVAYMCEIAHLRAGVLGFEVPPHGSCAFCPGGSRYEQVEHEARRLRELRHELDRAEK